MNKLFTGILALLSAGLTAQVITTTVSVGASYANQKWYSLENSEVGTQPKDNWDIAFEITGYSSAVLANTQKANFAVYRTPFEINDYGILDTAGISSWPMLYNSDTSWTVGAFNKGADLTDPFDLGWGVYDMNTHFVLGDSCFVVKLSPTSYKKLKIISLASGVYTFEYANINGANSFTQTITKAAYPGKNFVYADLSANSIVDREPTASSWDLSFGRYTAILNMPSPTPYPVVGIMNNKGVSIAQANNVIAAATYTDWASNTFNTNITTIGHDWKAIDLSTNAWKIVNDTVYFVKDRIGSIWKVRPISFGGSANGDFVFSKEKLYASPLGINEKGKVMSQAALYPNPSQGATSLVFSSEKKQEVSLRILDLNGKLISENIVEAEEGLSTHVLSTRGLQAGLYFVTLSGPGFSATQKLIIQ